MPQQSSILFKQSCVLFNPSSSKFHSLKRNNSTQLYRFSIPPQLPDMEKYDTNKLFEQFKRSLLRQDKKELNKHCVLNNGYKNLICQIKKNKQEKKKQLQGLSSKLVAMSQTMSQTVSQTKSSSSRYLLKDVKNHQPTKKVIEEPVEHSEKNSKQDFSNCKFRPIRPMTSQTKFRLNGNKSRITKLNSSEIKNGQQHHAMTLHNSRGTRVQTELFTNNLPSNHPQKSLPEISQCILMVQVEESQLQTQIFSLKQSLNKLKKELQIVKKELDLQARNEEKYKHIMYLATSILNQTEYIKQQNSKGFSSMAQRQDETITQLKKFKTTLKKEKDDMETEYIADINKWVQTQEENNATKNIPFLFSLTQTPKGSEDGKSPVKKFELITKAGSISAKPVSFPIKSMKKLVQQFDKIVQILEANEQNIGEIKQKQCTRVRLGKINKSLLPKQKLQILEKIQEFQNKYDMKISSVENLILKVHTALLKKNRALEADCLNLTNHRQQLYGDLKEIEEKHQSQLDIYEKQFKLLVCQEIDAKRRNQILRKNSIIFLKIISAYYMILSKFRYMFSLALTLDIDKKSFRDCIAQIDACFGLGMFFNFSAQKHLITSSQRHDIINEKEFAEILKDKKVGKDLAMEMTEMLFNDHRINLILHKSWVDNKLKFLTAGTITEDELLDLVESVRTECEKVYQMKLPTLANLFLTCLKSIEMTKQQSKLAASSKERQYIFIPSTKARNIHFVQMGHENNESCDRDDEISSYEPSKKKITFKTETEAKDEQVFEKDPRKIIYHLESIKNKNHKKFKALNFACEGKTYKYNQHIIIPDFPMMLKEQDF